MNSRPKRPPVERRQQPQPIAYVMPPASHHESNSMAVLETKVDALVRQSHETNETLRGLTRAVTQLAVIEERQTADRQAMDRAFGEIKNLQVSVEKLEHSIDTRIKVLESKAPVNDLSNGMVAKVAGLIVSAVVGAAMVLLLRQPVQPTNVQYHQPPVVKGAP